MYKLGVSYSLLAEMPSIESGLSKLSVRAHHIKTGPIRIRVGHSDKISVDCQ